MSRALPLSVDRRPSHHPAARAWQRLGGPPPDRIEHWRAASRSKPAIYRMTFARPRRPAVYAKHSATSDLAVERLLYQEILPRLPLPVAPWRGSVRDADGALWLFVESVGERRLSKRGPGHHALAARWLGSLHASAAGVAVARELPDAGPDRYLGHLRQGRDRVRLHSGNRALTARDREVLSGILADLDGLESRWPRLERACRGLPPTLVHGDFRHKNVRIRVAEGVPTLYALDWEMAGWGVPAADLASAGGAGLTLPIEPAVYRDQVRERWPDLDLAAIHRLSVLGRLFQAVAGTEWAAASLAFESPLHLLKPVASIRIYRAHMAAALTDGAEWLA